MFASGYAGAVVNWGWWAPPGNLPEEAYCRSAEAVPHGQRDGVARRFRRRDARVIDVRNGPARHTVELLQDGRVQATA